MSRTLCECEQIGFVDSLLLLTKIYDRRAEQQRFDAAMHGRTLK